MGNIRQESPKKGPNLDFNKALYRQSPSKKFGTYIEKFMVFKYAKKWTVFHL